MISKKDITELVSAGIINKETGIRINDYYFSEQENSSNKILVAFGILGAILIALGIILILAHNWDELPKSIKTILSFLPLLIGQATAFYTLIKKPNNSVWKESSSIFIFFAIASSISLIAQIYNISGDLPSFLLTWSLLSLPLVYIMNSRITSIGYIAVITYYATEVGYVSAASENTYFYWLLLAFIIPLYYNLLTKNPKSNFVSFHNWAIAISISIALGTLSNKEGSILMTIAYLSMYGTFYLFSNTKLFDGKKLISNGFRIIGSLGSISLLLALSFNWFWKELIKDDVNMSIFNTLSSFAALVLTLIGIAIFIYNNKTKKINNYDLIGLSFIPFIAIFFIGFANPLISQVLVNIMILVISVLTIKKGTKQNHLGILNYGLLILTGLIICRFFDTNISFIIRGLLFIGVGIGFFIANYSMIKKRKFDKLEEID